MLAIVAYIFEVPTFAVSLRNWEVIWEGVRARANKAGLFGCVFKWYVAWLGVACFRGEDVRCPRVEDRYVVTAYV